MKNYLIYKNTVNARTEAVQHVTVKTLIGISEEDAIDCLKAVKGENPVDVFQLVSAQFKTGVNIDKYVRNKWDGDSILKDKNGRPISRVVRKNLVHNVQTVKVI